MRDCGLYRDGGRCRFARRVRSAYAGNQSSTCREDFFVSGSPVEGIPADYWSMTATSTFTAPETGDVMFIMSGDDAYRLILDGKELFSDWGDHAETSRNATVHVEKGKKYDVRIEYYDNEYNAILRLQTLIVKEQ